MLLLLLVPSSVRGSQQRAGEHARGKERMNGRKAVRLARVTTTTQKLAKTSSAASWSSSQPASQSASKSAREARRGKIVAPTMNVRLERLTGPLRPRLSEFRSSEQAGERAGERVSKRGLSGRAGGRAGGRATVYGAQPLTMASPHLASKLN